MNYVVYGNRRSGSCVVEMALAEIGAPFEVRDVSLDDQRQRDESYAALNPSRKLPTLVTPDSQTLTESLAILLTLEERAPDAGLLPPRGSRERAEAIRWMCFIATEIYPIVEINDYPERFSPRPEDAGAMRERARELWRNRWLVVESHIAGDPWLLARDFSMADIYIGVISRWARQDDWRPDNLPRVEAIARALAGRPSSGPVFRRHFG
jgi:glutathione S-transferase